MASYKMATRWAAIKIGYWAPRILARILSYWWVLGLAGVGIVWVLAAMFGYYDKCPTCGRYKRDFPAGSVDWYCPFCGEIFKYYSSWEDYSLRR